MVFADCQGHAEFQILSPWQCTSPVPKAVDFYLHWVTQFYRFLNKQPGDTVTQQETDSYLKHLSKSRESWQVDQAAKAISLYQFLITVKKSQWRQNI